jgi:hypothetical protein
LNKLPAPSISDLAPKKAIQKKKKEKPKAITDIKEVNLDDIDVSYDTKKV